MKSVIKYIVLFVIFGSIYFVIESIWKGKFTDIRMFFLSGFIGVVIGCINNTFSFDASFILQCITGTLVALLCECIFGYQWNVVECRNLWDYSSLPFSWVADQINLFFSVIWFVLSALCILLDDWIRWKWFGEEKPRYKL